MIAVIVITIGKITGIGTTMVVRMTIDTQKDERRTSNFQHRMLNEKNREGTFLINCITKLRTTKTTKKDAGYKMHDAEMISCEECASALLSADYRFAKTMPENPHWYTLRRTWNNDDLFDKVVEYMRANSYREYFWRKPYQMFDLNGYTYWTMGAEIGETILINRKPKLRDQAADKKGSLQLTVNG